MIQFLTIAIPTYNRNAMAQASIRRLEPQLGNGVDLIVLDNHSTIPISLNPPANHITIIRNADNLGGNGNIIRCLESCDSKWIWILGDDDEVHADSVCRIIDAISGHPNALMFNFSTAGSYQRETSFSGMGRTQFLNSMDDFGNLLFISSNIYDRKKLLKYLEFGYHFAYSCAPHLAMLLMALSGDQEFIFSEKTIVRWQRPEIENRGSVVTVALGLPTLLELPISRDERRQLAGYLSQFPKIAAVAHQCFLQCLFTTDDRRSIRNSFRAVLARIRFIDSPRRTIEGHLWQLLLYFPFISYHLIVRPLYKWRTGHESGPQRVKLERL